nr:hypothetical protein [uncultured Albidiferax sp.]
MSPEQRAHLDKVIAVTEQLIESPILRDLPHHVAMDAMLTLFSTYATSHPCCTANAALACERTAQRLTTRAMAIPAGTAIH